MFLTIFPIILIVLGVGYICKIYFDKTPTYSNIKISWIEFGITSLVISLVVVPATTYLGWKAARNNRMTFNEYWNGWESAAVWNKIRCTRDGPCYWEYQCDPYIVMVPYSCNCTKNGCSTCMRPETRYHDCPYCTEEWTFTVNTTLGPFTIDANRLPDNPNENRWRQRKVVSEDIQRRAGVGIPQFWADAKRRIDNNTPGPVTKIKQYKNFLLVADASIFQKYKGDIESYSSDNLLPPIVQLQLIENYYKSKKVYFVGLPTDTLWNNRVAYINGSLGHNFQGDLKVVLTKNAQINNDPDKYTQTLLAYWSNWELHGENALPKNSIVLVLGTADGKVISWARAFSGMPTGNELLIASLPSLLKNTMLHPDSVLGIVSANQNYAFTVTNGIVAKLMLYSPTQYVRESMSAYEYLKGEIQPLPKQKFIIRIIAIILAGLCWIVPIMYTDSSSYQRSHQHSHFHSRNF